MNISTHDADLVNEDILADLESDFFTFLKARDFSNCEAIVDNLRDLKQFSKGIELAKKLAAARMRVPDGYGEEDRCPSGASYLHRYIKGQCLKCEKVESFTDETEESVW